MAHSSPILVNLKQDNTDDTQAVLKIKNAYFKGPCGPLVMALVDQILNTSGFSLKKKTGESNSLWFVPNTESKQIQHIVAHALNEVYCYYGNKVILKKNLPIVASYESDIPEEEEELEGEEEEEEDPEEEEEDYHEGTLSPDHGAAHLGVWAAALGFQEIHIDIPNSVVNFINSEGLPIVVKDVHMATTRIKLYEALQQVSFDWNK